VELALAPAAAVAVVPGLGVELRLFAPSRAPRRGEAILWSTGWLLLAVAVAAPIALSGCPAGEWTTVYLIDRSLRSTTSFCSRSCSRTPRAAGAARPRHPHRHRRRAPAPRPRDRRWARTDRERRSRCLRLRRAAPLRGLSRLPWRRRPVRPSANPVLRLVRRTVPITADVRGRRLFVRHAGRLRGTPLLLAVVAIIVAGIAFEEVVPPTPAAAPPGGEVSNKASTRT
jgi:hypothetical protein